MLTLDMWNLKAQVEGLQGGDLKPRKWTWQLVHILVLGEVMDSEEISQLWWGDNKNVMTNRRPDTLRSRANKEGLAKETKERRTGREVGGKPGAWHQ